MVLEISSCYNWNGQIGLVTGSSPVMRNFPSGVFAFSPVGISPPFQLRVVHQRSCPGFTFPVELVTPAAFAGSGIRRAAFPCPELNINFHLLFPQARGFREIARAAEWDALRTHYEATSQVRFLYFPFRRIRLAR